MIIDAEVWKDIPGYVGEYQASSLGRVKSLRRLVNCKGGVRIVAEKIKAATLNNQNGYLAVTLRTRDTKSVHSIVAMAFFGDRPEANTVNHKDGNKQNNRLNNLEYVPHKENIAHAIRTGLTDNNGENNGCSKMSEAQVVEAHGLYASGMSMKAVAEQFGVRKQAIGKIVLGHRWSHLGLAPIRKRRKRNEAYCDN